MKVSNDKNALRSSKQHGRGKIKWKSVINCACLKKIIRLYTGFRLHVFNTVKNLLENGHNTNVVVLCHVENKHDFQDIEEHRKARQKRGKSQESQAKEKHESRWNWLVKAK